MQKMRSAAFFIGLAVTFIFLGNCHKNAAFKLAKGMRREKTINLLRREGKETPRTFEDPSCFPTLNSDGISMLNYGINLINSSIKISGRFFAALQDLYHTDNNTIKTVIYDNLESYSTYSARKFKENMDSDLEATAISFYTYLIYSRINSFLREHKCGKMNLTDDAKNLGPYSAYLMAVLMFSPLLSKETNTTYREVSFDEEMIDQYEIGTTFLWSSFSSSSMFNMNFFGNVEFVFNNSRSSLWSPRRIEQYSFYPEEEEALYPPAAMFKITEKTVKGKDVYIYADLVNQNL
ncbi:uncharacterized protein LOC133178399 [Saccostrea echinata]|uniref:uncharacterized protein LOC133178399 n=1 Tax=Saccostrea echinata TaxID=191078 RepID=UPI002A838955|nr:uncharacterized protein LOC133178399 [Saccostrea echinata]